MFDKVVSPGLDGQCRLQALEGMYVSKHRVYVQVNPRTARGLLTTEVRVLHTFATYCTGTGSIDLKGGSYFTSA